MAKSKEEIKEYKKKWYKTNKEKVKEIGKKYRENNKDKVKESSRKSNRRSYVKNREERLSKSKLYVKETNYKYEKTESQRIIRNIKRKTRYHFPLEGNNCKCGKNAEVRHHTTNPIEFDKFDFLCKLCHNKVHGNINNTCKEVKDKDGD